jgi:hypothetical protein
MLEVHLAPSKQCFHYNPANENYASIFGLVEGMFFDQNTFNAFSPQKKLPYRINFKAFTSALPQMVKSLSMKSRPSPSMLLQFG